MTDSGAPRGDDSLPAAASRPRSPFLVDRVGFAVFSCYTILAFTTAIETQFTLPKLLGIHLFGVFSGQRLWVHWKAGRTRALPRTLALAWIALVAWWVLTSLEAQHLRTALFGVYGRYNGLFTLLVAMALSAAFAMLRMDDREIEARLVWLSVPVTIAAAYAVVQLVGLDPLPWPTGRPASTLGHPVTLGAVLAMTMPFLLAIGWLTASRRVRTSALAAVALVTVALVATRARGPWGASAVGVVMFTLLAAPNRSVIVRRTLVTVAGALLLVAVTLPFGELAGSEVVARIEQFARVSTDRSASNRLLFYQASLRMLRDHPGLGVGLENFPLLYPRYRAPLSEAFAPDVIPTMVHSGYLQAAVSGGAPALLLYLLVVGLIASRLAARWQASDARPRVVGAALIASMAVYLVQDITGWPDVALATLAWVIWGLGLAWSGVDHGESRQRSLAAPLLAVVMCLGSAWLSFDTWQRIRSDRWVFEARRLNPVQSWDALRARLDAAVRISPDGAWVRDTAARLYQQRVALAGDGEAYEWGIRLTEEARARNPFDPYMRVRRVEFDIAALERKLIPRISDGAQQALIEAKWLDPYNAAVSEAEARLSLSAGFPDAALASITQALALRPGWSRYVLVQGDVLRALGRQAEAEEAFRNVVSSSAVQGAESISARRRLVYVLLETGQARAAAAEAQRLVSAAAGDPIGLVLLGVAHETLQDPDTAARAFRRALSLDPTNLAAREGLARTTDRLRPR